MLKGLRLRWELRKLPTEELYGEIRRLIREQASLPREMLKEHLHLLDLLNQEVVRRIKAG